jgi:ribonuclease BN (tRNA processing enzyme)
VSDSRLRRAIPDTSAPKTSSAPSTVSAVSVDVIGVQSQTFSAEEERSGLQITVLGKSPSWQDADGACSGYLVEEDGACVLLDCGNGVFSKLRRFRDYIDVDAVVISHLHADHFLDLVPFAYALTYAPRQQPVPVDRWPGTDNPARPKLHAPRGAAATFRRVVGAWGNEDLIEKAFDLVEYDPDAVLDIGTLQVRFSEVPHFTTTFAVGISSTNGGGRLTYGADSGPNDALVRFAEAADLLIIEATLPRPEREGPRGHLTPAEAGEHGSRARVGRLVLTHISDELDERWARAEAEEAFGGPVLVAREGAVYTV